MKTADKILNAAIELAAEGDYVQITRADIATRCGVAEGLVSYHFGLMDDVRDMIIAEAVKRNIAIIIARALLDKHPRVAKLSKRAKKKACETIASGEYY